MEHYLECDEKTHANTQTHACSSCRFVQIKSITISALNITNDFSKQYLVKSCRKEGPKYKWDNRAGSIKQNVNESGFLERKH